MGLLIELPEICIHITKHLSDRMKYIFLSCTKTLYNYKKLLRFESKYYYSKIRGQWCLPCVKNIFIDKFIDCPDFTLGIKKFIEDSTLDSTLIKPTYIKLMLNENRINLHYSSCFLNIFIINKHHNTLKKIISIITIKDEILIEACKNGLFKLAKILIYFGANVCAHDNDAIILASDQGDYSIVKLLINYGANVNAQNKLPIIKASYRGHWKVVRLLADCGADIFALNDMPLIKASHQGHMEVVRFLIEKCADVNAQNGLPIIEASRQGPADLRVISTKVDIIENTWK